MAAGIKKNFFYNMILTTGNYIFPLLTYPYVSRVLGVSNIGICNYVDSFIHYGILLALLGIGSFGIREIASVKDDVRKKTQVFSSLLFINVFLTTIAVIVLIILTLYVPLFGPYRPFLFVGLFKLIFSAFLIEWFFKGLSDFKYITVRSLAVRTAYVILVFIFVQTKDDTIVYYFLTCMTVVINAIVNWMYSRRFVRFSFRIVRVREYVMPVLSYGIYLILTSMYTTFNVAFLGSVSGDTEVGYFTTATKLYGILMSVYGAFSAVMVPQISALLSKGNNHRLRELAGKTFNLVFLFSIPLIVVSFFYAPLIIYLLSGKGYEGAIAPFRIVMSLLLIIALEQIIVGQFLLALRNSKCILQLSILGAIVGVSLNILLTPHLASVGSAISWVSSEISVLCLAMYFFHKNFNIRFPVGEMIKAFVLALPYVVICIIFAKPELSFYSAIGLLLAGSWFFISNLRIRKDPILSEILTTLTSRLKQ